MKLLSIKALLLAVAVGLSACDTGPNSTAGIEGTGSPTTVGGSVTSYGSVYVNGVHISTSGARVYVNGETAAEEDLKLGMVVHVELPEGAALDETAVAETIHYRRSLRGLIADVPESNDVRKVLVALGQLVVVYDDAVFDGLAFEDLEPGLALDVSGFNDEQGRLIAARVAAASEESPGEVRARIANLDLAQSRFEMGTLTVDFTDSVFESGESDLLEEGGWVRLIGGEEVDSVYYPEAVEIEDASEASDSAQGRISREGLVESYESPDDFVVSGIRVNAADMNLADAALEGMGLGVRVVVSGLMEEGVLQADELQLVLPGVDRVKAAIDSVNPDTGEVLVLGETYTISNLTAYEDRALGQRVMNLSEIYPGDFVELHARSFEEGRIATRIKRLGSDEEMSLRGSVTRVGQTSITVMGVEVSLSASADAELLADLRIGDRVQAVGSGNSDGFSATGISLSPLPEGRGPCPPAFELECEEPLVPGPRKPTQALGERSFLGNLGRPL